MTEKSKELIEIETKSGIIQFLEQPAVKIAEVLTGIFASNKTDLALSAGRLVQASIKFKLFTQFGRELKGYIKKGKIKEDYFATDKNQASLHELLKFIDEKVPDKEWFKAMKSIFFTSISKESTQSDEEFAYEFLRIGKHLSGSEILILKVAFEISTNQIKKNVLVSSTSNNLNITRADTWFEMIARQIGHGMPDLVARYESNLMDLKLITGRIQPHNYNVPSETFEKSDNFRLTSLGCKLCEFITQYE